MAGPAEIMIREGFVRLAGLIKQRGVKAGGTAGQVYAKTSNVDYETGWIDLPAAADGGAQINDTATSGSSVWSSSKTSSEIATSAAAVKSDLLGGATAEYDTLKELRDLLASSDLEDDSALGALTEAVANRVRFDAPQTLTAEQQTQAQTNIGALAAADFGATDTDYVALIEAELAS